MERQEEKTRQGFNGKENEGINKKRKEKRREEKTGQRFIGKWKTRRCKKGEGRKARRLENSSWIGNGN